MNRQFVFALILATRLLVVASFSHAGPYHQPQGEVQAILYSPAYAVSAQSLALRYNAKLISVESPTPLPDGPLTGVIVLGGDALEASATLPDSVEKHVFYVSNYQAHSYHQKNDYHFWYRDALPENELALAEQLFPQHARTVLLYSERTSSLADQYRREAKQRGRPITLLRIDQDSDLVGALRSLSPRDVLVAIEDDSIYREDTVYLLLRHSMRRGVPILGFNTHLVDAGAAATTAPTIDFLIQNIFAQTPEVQVHRNQNVIDILKRGGRSW